MTAATPPIEWGKEPADLEDAFPPAVATIDDTLAGRLAATGAEVRVDAAARAEASRDWWPLAQRWSLVGRAPARPAAIVRPKTAAQTAAVVRVAAEAGIPVTATAGRSGVCGGAVPVFGGIALDCCGLTGVTEIDDESLRVTVAAGEFGSDLEDRVRTAGLTIGHFPQSMALATVGGWIACRGAGQYSTRYGKIEDIVAGLEVVLADGRIVRTGALAGAGPRSAMGPDLTQLFVGSEGTLGIVTAASLRAHPLAGHESRSAFAFPTFAAGLEALRRTLRRGATPAVLRLYDERESGRSFDLPGTNVLVALDEGHEPIVEAAMSVLADCCQDEGATRLDEGLVARWLEHRNDVSALASLTRGGIVVDTIEVAASWSALPELYADATSGLAQVEGCLNASAHESHAYLDGACLYFTFAGRGEDPADERWALRFYEESWKRVMEATRRHGGSISHHHGIGIVRGPFLREALGEGWSVLRALKSALDPAGILNPGKLGLPSPFGDAPSVSGARLA